MNPLPLQSILLSDTPLIDVRAEIEFKAGSFPSARNMPILNDHERALVGICYKDKGPDAAKSLGHELVSGAIRENRIDTWCEFISQNPGAKLYCFRGGLRSTLAQQWLQDRGIQIEKIKGGYKALRQSLLAVYEDLPELIVVAGKTGTGKTEFLARVPNKVDLEYRANHRGSAFGKQLSEQPAQIDFENRVALDFLKLRSGPVLIEDESRLIGRINLPLLLQKAMAEAPIVLLEDSVENRIARINKEYLVEQFEALSAQTGSVTKAQDELERIFLDSLGAIKKRLGPERHRSLVNLMGVGFQIQKTGDFSAHNAWIRVLLEEYYDPMYEYQLSKKQSRIIGSGTQEGLLEYADYSPKKP